MLTVNPKAVRGVIDIWGGVCYDHQKYIGGGNRVRPKSNLYPMTVTAVIAAIMAVISPFALFLGPIPVSFCTLLVCLNVYVLGWRRGTAATLIYILMGAVGMPVFGGFSGGAGTLLGPTGGYILGYLALSVITGLSVDLFPRKRGVHILGMVLGTVVLYGFGTTWYCIQAGQSLNAAVSVCVLPFVPGDCGKILAAGVMGPILRDRLAKAGLI